MLLILSIFLVVTDLYIPGTVGNASNKLHNDHYHPSLYNSRCWPQVSIQNESAWAVAASADWEHYTIHCIALQVCGG